MRGSKSHQQKVLAAEKLRSGKSIAYAGANLQQAINLQTFFATMDLCTTFSEMVIKHEDGRREIAGYLFESLH